MSSFVVILGAPDPEMDLIERLASAAGLPIRYAQVDGTRVHPGNAYRADAVDLGDILAPRPLKAVVVECHPAAVFDSCPDGFGIQDVQKILIDHHRPGDPGYGQPPAELLPASSVGQFLRWMLWEGYIARLPLPMKYLGNVHMDTFPGTWEYGSPAVGWSDSPPLSPCWYIGDQYGDPWALPANSEVLLAAAADHCLAAAYRGECPGVDPEALFGWRLRTRAQHQGRSVAEVEADVQSARRALAEAPRIVLGGVQVADLRPIGTVPEAPEAAARDGIPFLARVQDRDGRTKVVLQAAPQQAVRALLDGALGLADVYGDPARGFAGGYE